MPSESLLNLGGGAGIAFFPPGTIINTHTENTVWKIFSICFGTYYLVWLLAYPPGAISCLRLSVQVPVMRTADKWLRDALMD